MNVKEKKHYLVEKFNPLLLDIDKFSKPDGAIFLHSYLIVFYNLVRIYPRGNIDLLLFLCELYDLNKASCLYYFKDLMLRYGVFEDEECCVQVDFDSDDFVSFVKNLFKSMHRFCGTNFNEAYFLKAVEDFRSSRNDIRNKE